MNDRERILAAIRGEIPDRIPWVPRLEFWYRARRRRGDMPAGLLGLSLREVTERLGVGHYASVPDFTEREEETDMADHGLGIFNHPVLPYRVVLEGVERRVTRRGQETIAEYQTPVGVLRTAEIFTEEMLDGGASIPWTSEHAIRQPADFDTAAYIFSRLRVEPRAGAWERRCRAVGDRGVAVAYVIGTACPVHHIMKELMPVEQFFLAQHDYPEKIDLLAEAMQPYYAAMQRVSAETGAEILLLGGNYDDSITHPKWFENYILPALRDYAQTLHAKGKYLMTHTDGENRRLIPLYLRAGFDIADSLCPAPMTRMTLEQIRAAFEDRITIWGGIPSVLLCPDSVGESQFRLWIDRLVERYGHASRFVLGVSDMVTADASWDRLMYITEKVASL
ncbi:MAG: uroporphyrinogen decarboxylase family protein [Bryobacterales bacterium]|nr:uroporphyrinogen decarboxylase family protein [Bryobacterales bacterium]